MAVPPLDPWTTYQLFEIPPHWERADLGVREARRVFDLVMGQRESRVDELKRLLRAFGIDLDGTDDSVRELEAWFHESVFGLLGKSGIPDGRTLSLCEDVALYLGDLMIARHSNLQWSLYRTEAGNPDRHSHVISGFTDEPVWRKMAISRNVYNHAVGVLEARQETIPDLEVAVHGMDLTLPGESLRMPVKRDAFSAMMRLAAELNQPGAWSPA